MSEIYYRFLYSTVTIEMKTPDPNLFFLVPPLTILFAMFLMPLKLAKILAILILDSMQV